MREPILTSQQVGDIEALSDVFQSFSSVFDGGDGTPATLNMASAACRRAADTLDEIAEAWLRQEQAA